MQVKNLKYNQLGTIDCEIEHSTFGWIPFTASPDDCESLGKEVYAKAIAGEYGEISPYVAPEPEPLTQEQIDALRLAAYQSESDPLFFKYQRGEIEKQVWLDKVQEIKERYPLLKYPA